MNIDLENLKVDVIAQRLLGCYLVRTINKKEIIGKIVEVEAYDQFDAASHSFKGTTPRTEIMFGPPNHLYVYFTYGMHYCLNIVTGPVGYGAAVLIRAVEPVKGLKLIKCNRPNIVNNINLTNGPAKLCQALGINLAFNGHDLNNKPLTLQINSKIPSNEIVCTTRVGISKAKDLKWRFYLRNNKFVSCSINI